VLALDAVTLLSPVANPGKLVAAPVNYEKHLAEVKGDASLHQNTAGHTLTIHKAGVFLKATSSLAGAGEGVALRMPDRRTDHEVELAFVIGRTASRVPRAEALGYVAGYTIGLDISIRGTEDRSFRKSADTYSVLGPWLVTADEIVDPGTLDLEISVNGERRQHSNTRNMTLGVAELIEMASAFYTLHPGRRRIHRHARRGEPRSSRATKSSPPSRASARCRCACARAGAARVPPPLPRPPPRLTLTWRPPATAIAPS
jgi:2-keto-4-pentenoate hydratase/2-oxohepta-3-ene-1,7-dioic acid hydratase in catechol pathway